MKAFTEDEITGLREALSKDDPSCAPGRCPNKEELWESAAGELDPVENETIILHLAHCSECSLIWQLAREMLPPDRVPSPSVIPMSGRSHWRTWRKVLIPAIAATMLIGVGLSAAWFVRKGASTPPVFRQQQDDDRILTSPRTQALPRTACRLEWSAGPDGTRYDLVATDERLEVLSAVVGLAQAECVLPPNIIPISTRKVFWRVTAHLPDGRTLTSETFTTRIEDPTPTPGR